MEKRNIRLLSIISLVLGIIFLINSKTNITGAVINSSSISSTFSSIFGVILILVSVILFIFAESLEGRLEDKVHIYETRRGKTRFVEIKGMDSIAPLIQANNNGVIGPYHINLKDLNELLGAEYISLNEREKISNRYGHFFKEKMYEGLRDYSKYKQTHKKLTVEDKNRNKEERDRIAKELREARASERVLQILDPSYKTIRERLTDFKKSHKGEPHVVNPIIKRNAVYVRYTSEEEVEDIEKNKIMAGTKQSLYFPSLEKAQKFINDTPKDIVKTITGAGCTDRAIVFQTIYAPDKMNTLVGKESRSMHKAFFKDLEKDTCYFFRVYNPPR
ncbi:MAG: hypothetical protein AABX94_01605 [Nanoarchaeota archaeon]